MPLRGTVRKQNERAIYNQRPTLQNQITRLQSQVARNKPETLYFRSSSDYTAASLGRYQINILPTSSLIGSTEFRNNVTGDKWRNLTVDFSALLKNTNAVFRIMCYVPKKTGERFTPSSEEFNRHPDPSAFWVISDEIVTNMNTNSNNASKNRGYKKRFNLKGLHTLYNSSSANLEKGEIVISVLGSAASIGSQFEYGWELKYQNM